MSVKKRVLSGIRATGRLHLGNYLGMVKGMLDLQNDINYEVFFMVADLHAMTTPFDPKKLKQNVREVAIDYLAAGLDPKKATVFVQSHVGVHEELAYLFSTAVSVARMSHLPTFKEKVKQHPENVTMAMLSYPILMAADILAYKTSQLPVGDDQLPHLEITREIARKLNNKYGTDFPQPKQMKAEGQYVPSLTGEGKMSKSVEGSFINLTDSLETIKSKLATAPTDSGKGKEIPEKGGVANLFTFVELFQGKKKRNEYEKQYLSTGVKYSQLKESLAKAIYKELKPIQKRRVEIVSDQAYIDKILEDGAKKAKKVAANTLDEVKVKMGLK